MSTFAKLVASFVESDRTPIIRDLTDDARRVEDEEHERRAVKDLLNKGSAVEIAQAIDSGQLAIERAITTLAANRRSAPGLDDVVANSRMLTMNRRAHTANIGAAVTAGQITRRDLRRCAKAWEDVAEPLLRVAVLAAPLADAERNDLLACASELATVLQDQGRFDEAWQMVKDHVQFSHDYPPLALTAAALLVHSGELDRAIDQTFQGATFIACRP